MTVYEYLDKKRAENPQYRQFSDIGLYKKLQGEDPNIPKWKSSTSTGVKTNQQDPGFMNSLFDWTDYGINETSAKFAKSAYNNSITGLAYQLHNGEARFDLDDYDPGIAEDIFSAVLSFAMPLDMASMFVGGAAGKTLTTLGSAGLKEGMVKSLTGKAAFKKTLGEKALKSTTKKELAKAGIKKTPLQRRKELAEDYVNNLIKDRGLSPLYTKPSQSYIAGAQMQGATLAVFEGVRGGFQAAVDGENIWKGVGKGIAHGGMMGAASGALGASLNFKHGELLKRYADEDFLNYTQKAKKLATGTVGQIVAETTVFTAPELKNVIGDENYGMRELMRSWATNAGMMGVLKAKGKLWNKGKDEIGKWADREGLKEYLAAQDLVKSTKAVKQNIQQNMPENTPAEKAAKKAALEQLSNFRNRQIRNAELTIKEYESWEADYKKATDIVEGVASGKIKNVDADQVLDVMRQIHAVRGAMIKNKNLGIPKNLSKEQRKLAKAEREAEINRLEKLEKQWETEIEGPLRNIESGIDPNIATQKTIRVGYTKSIKKALKENPEAVKELREGLENVVDAKGNITNVKEFNKLAEQAEINRKSYEDVYGKKPKKIIQADPDVSKSKQVFDTEVKNQEAISDKAKKIKKLTTSEKKGEEPLNKKDKQIQETEYTNPEGETTQGQIDAYKKSKEVLSYFARTFFSNKQLIAKKGDSTKLGHADKLAKYLAKEGKSFFEMTDADFADFIKKNPSISKDSASSIIRGLADIASLNRNQAAKLFNEKFKLLFKPEIGKSVYRFVGEIRKKAKVEGAQIEGDAAIYSSDGKIEISTKTGFIEKYTSRDLIKSIRSLAAKTVRKLTRPGHEEFLFKVKDGGEHVVIQNYQLSGIIKEIFGVKKSKAGEARLFRKSINQWAVEKYKEGAVEIDIVYEKITGHKPSGAQKVATSYQKAISQGELPARVNKILKEYIKDIKSGKVNYGRGKEGYTTLELRKGLKNLDKLLLTKKDNVFEIINKGKKEKVTIDNATLETMVNYLLKTGPRLNEVSIDSQTFNMLTKYQLNSKIKAGQSIVGAEKLAQQVAWVKKKFPKLSVQIEKTLGKVNGQYVLGKIHNHLIKIASGRAKIDTLPHEVSHHVVDILKEFGDPISKKIVKDGIRMFRKKKMTEAQAEEAFVEALGKYTAKELPKGMIGRMKSWTKRAVSYMRQYFGMRNQNDVNGMKQDIVRIIGGKVISGKIPTDYLSPSNTLKVKYQTQSTSQGKKVIKELQKQTEDARQEAIDTYGAKESMLKSLEADVLGPNRNIKSKDITGGELERIQQNYRDMFKSVVEGKSAEYAKNHAKVKGIEAEYNISESQRDAYFERFDTKFEKASQDMINTYKSYIALGDKIKPLQNTNADAFKAISDTNINSTLPIWKRAFFKSADYIRRFSPKIARNLELHDFTRSFEMKGPGERGVERIKSIVKSKRVQDNYMHLIDPVLAKNAINQLKKLSTDKTLSESRRNRFKKEYVEALSIREKFTKGEYVEAGKQWKEISDFYWNNLLLAIKKNTPSNTEFAQIREGLNERYIQEYFVRRPTKEVVQHIHENSNVIQKMAEREIKKLSLEDLKRIKKQGKTPEDVVAAEIMQMIKFGPLVAKPSFLKERGVTLPEYMEIPTKDGGKKLVKSYESNIDATMSTYVNGMSKFIATVKHFPEFTELGGKFALKGSTGREIVEQLQTKMLGGNKSPDAVYAFETVKKQLGLDQNMIDVLNQPVAEGIGKITNWSAVLGLSSPLAGLKNVMIQLPRSIAVYGAKNTYKGFAKAMKTELGRNPNNKEWLKAVERGETGYGQKELLFGADSKIKWWFDNVNLMTQTENLNRIMTAEAGRLHFAELVSSYKKQGSGFFPKSKKAEIDRMFTDIFRLSDKQMKHLRETKDLHNSVEYENILNYVGFTAHKASAGATGVSDLPLWMSNKYMKPLTLFQRMAYSVTIDSYKNYVKPLKNGNVAPLVKATLGHMATGAALYGLYDKLMGQQIPVEENDALSKAVSYIWRGEMLGVFGEAISPYTKRGNINPLMEPVIVRNISSAGQEIINMISNGKPVDMALQDFARQTIVIGAQAEKIWNKSTNPYAVNVKRIATLERQWRKEMGSGYEQTSGGVLKERHYAYRRLKNALLLNNSDSDIAKAYYVAYNTLLDERTNGGFVNMSENKKYARKTIMRMIEKMNPLDISKETKGRVTSRRKEFLNYLSSENQKLALKLEKEFQYKVRKFKSITKRGTYKRLYANHI